MQWLVHGSLHSAAVLDALRRRGDQVHEPSELQLGGDVEPAELLEAARKKQYDLITSDSRLVQWIFDQKIRFARSIVLLQVSGDVEQDDAIDRLFARYKRLTPGRLYTVTESRVKIRQLPTVTGPRSSDQD